MNPVLREGGAYPFAKLEARRDELRAKGLRLFDFTVGDPLEPTPAFIREALVRSIPEVSRYPTVAGKPSLRRAVAAYFERRFGMQLDPDREIIPCAGAKEAVFHLPLAIVDRASEKRAVLFGEPGYPVYERGAAYAGGDPVAIPLRRERGFLLEPEDIPEALLRRTCLLWINYPHNPTGASADLDYLGRVVEAGRKYGFIVAADETYADVFDETPPPSLLQVAKENVLVIHSLSKRSGMTGYRSGFMAGDPKLIAALRKMRPSIGVASQEFVQAAAEAAWNDEAHVEERRRIFAAKRAKVLALCDELNLQALRSGTALYEWIAVPDGETSSSYAERLLDGGVVVTPGGTFGPAGEGFIRVALVPPLAELDEALAAWRAAHHRPTP